MVADSFHFCSPNANPQFKKPPRGKQQEALQPAACSGGSWKDGRKRAPQKTYKQGKEGGRETQDHLPRAQAPVIKGAIEVIPGGLRADSGVTEMEAPPLGAVVEAK